MNRPRALDSQMGMTLAEVLVATAAFALFAATAQRFMVTTLRGVRVLEVTSEAHEAARVGVQLMVRDLREAGFNPAGTSWSGITLAQRDAIRIARDLDGDGETDDSNERVSYSLHADPPTLMRGQGKAPAQPMLADLAAEGLEFIYFDDEGLAIPLPPAGLSASQRAQIHRVDVRLLIEMRHPDPSYEVPIRSLQTASVHLRNHRP